MNSYLMTAFSKEIDFMNQFLAYENADELQPLQDTKEAQTQIDGMLEGMTEEEQAEIPEGLKMPEVMLIVFNHCVEQAKDRAEKRKVQAEDDSFAEEHPGWLRFRTAYPGGASCFFDPDCLISDLRRCGFDDKHREIIASALIEYQKRWNADRA